MLVLTLDPNYNHVVRTAAISSFSDEVCRVIFRNTYSLKRSSRLYYTNKGQEFQNIL